MSSLVEHPDGTLVLTVRITLKPGRDDDLIALVRAAPARGLAAAIREAMRSGAAAPAGEADDDFILPDIGMEI